MGISRNTNDGKPLKDEFYVHPIEIQDHDSEAFVLLGKDLFWVISSTEQGQIQKCFAYELGQQKALEDLDATSHRLEFNKLRYYLRQIYYLRRLYYLLGRNAWVVSQPMEIPPCSIGTRVFFRWPVNPHRGSLASAEFLGNWQELQVHFRLAGFYQKSENGQNRNRTRQADEVSNTESHSKPDNGPNGYVIWSPICKNGDGLYFISCENRVMRASSKNNFCVTLHQIDERYRRLAKDERLFFPRLEPVKIEDSTTLFAPMFGNNILRIQDPDGDDPTISIFEIKPNKQSANANQNLSTAVFSPASTDIQVGKVYGQSVLAYKNNGAIYLVRMSDFENDDDRIKALTIPAAALHDVLFWMGSFLCSISKDTGRLICWKTKSDGIGHDKYSRNLLENRQEQPKFYLCVAAAKSIEKTGCHWLALGTDNGLILTSWKLETDKASPHYPLRQVFYQHFTPNCKVPYKPLLTDKNCVYLFQDQKGWKVSVLRLPNV